MKKITKIILSVVLSSAMLMQSAAFAQTFSDMPDNWTTGALKWAVENGLLNGADGKIMPDDNIKRSEMAAIIVRAFGANVEADISMYPDMSTDKWYYSEFAKAVQMGAFSGTDDGKLNPEAPITYEECFTVISRIFCLVQGNPYVQSRYDNVDVSVLDPYSDRDNIAQWAEKYTALVVGKGYWNGYEGKLKPHDQYITRSEFAVLMDNLITTYINEPGEYTEFSEGNILIRSEGVSLSGYNGDGIIIIGDGVTGETLLNEIVSTNEIISRGGTTIITGTINDASIVNENTVLDLNNIEKRNGIIYNAKGTNLLLGNVSVVPGA